MREEVTTMKVEKWCGHDIRFVEIDNEWWAILKDICDALDLHTFKVSQRLETEMLKKILVPASVIPSKYNRSRGENKTRLMLAVNELGIYEALFASKRLEARKFKLWTYDILQKLRRHVGLKGYEVMRMTEPEIQEEIDFILDTIFYDEERGGLMRSVTVQGGDVEQIPFDPQERI